MALLIAVTGVFAAPGSVPGADQSDVALAAGSDEGQVEGQIVESNTEEQGRGETWHWVISPEQEEMANEILEQDPDTTIGEMLEEIAPEVLERLVQDLDDDSPIKPLFDPEFKWRLGMVEKVSFHADPDGTGGAMAIGTKDMLAWFGAAAEEHLEKGVPPYFEERAIPIGNPSNPICESDIHCSWPPYWLIGFSSWTRTLEIWPYLWVQSHLQVKWGPFCDIVASAPMVVAYNTCYVYSSDCYDFYDWGHGYKWRTLGHHLSVWYGIPFEEFSHTAFYEF